MARAEWRVYEPTAQQLIDVQEMSRNGLTYVQIAGNMRVGEQTFSKMRKRYPDLQKALDNGRFGGVQQMAGMLWQSAVDGNVAAQIFWMKVRGNMSEKQATAENPSTTAAKPHKINLKNMDVSDATRIYQQVMRGEYKE